ncbi:MAG: DUF86 domain-containing protein [bacterium]|nr:DUF86 domain-containing protein [bacterium]
MTRDYLDYIHDILNSMNEVEEFTWDMEYEVFSSDRKTINAVIRSLEVMGEAAAKIPPDIRDKYPDIPWKRMVGMRNKLIHDYFGVDLEIVWTVCKKEIPPLQPFVMGLLADLEGNSHQETDDDSSAIET